VQKIFSSCLSRTQLGFNTLNNLFAKIFQKKKKQPSDSTKIIDYIYSLLVVSSSLFFALFCSREREEEERERAFVGVFVCVCFWCVEKSYY